MAHKIFIEAGSIALSRRSGVGHSALEIIRTLDTLAPTDELDISLIVPFGSSAVIESYGFQNIRIRRLPPGRRIVNYLFARTGLPLPVDLWYGRGTYLFLDYKNWYVPFSRSITLIHDLVFCELPETVNPKNRAYLAKNMSRWLKRSDVILASSISTATELKRYYPGAKAKLKTILLGVNPQEFYRRPKPEVAKMCSTHQLPRQYFLFIGNIEPRKNLLALLNAYERYSDRTKEPIALLLIGGDGWNNQAIWDKILDLQDRGYKVVQSSHYISDVDLPALYSGARALVLVSFHEGFGLPPLQAQACGTPVIVSDLPIFHETLRDKSTRYIVKPDVETIADALSDQKPVHFDDYAPLTWQRTATELIDVIRKGPNR